LVVVSREFYPFTLCEGHKTDRRLQNDGSKTDAASQAKTEFASWPYPWLEDEAYHSRGSVSGKLVLSDGRPASNAAVFLGDVLPSNKTALDMGSTYYYTTYADASGSFSIADVRTGSYGLQAWSNGSSIRDVTTTFTLDSLSVTKDENTDLGSLTWAVSPKKKLFQVGDFDHYSYGFKNGGAPWQHALVDQCPVNLVYKVGCSKTEDWCMGQTYKGNWTIRFWNGQEPDNTKQPTLIVSLAGYSSGASSTIWANGVAIGNLTSGATGTTATYGLASDPCLYRSATAAGEWRYFEFGFGASVLKKGANEVTFQMTRNTTWHGFMWDSIILEW
jgi:rhamnogalacturonan endolyase